MIQLLLIVCVCELVASRPKRELDSLKSNGFPTSRKLDERRPEKESAHKHGYYRPDDDSDKMFPGYSFSKIHSVSQKDGIVVQCGERDWRIVVKREFFGRGLPLSRRSAQLGESSARECGPQTDLLTALHLLISAPLQHCGSESRVSGEWLIYSNKLVFSSAPLLTLDGVLIFRRARTLVPIECHYKRKFRVSAEPLSPTWLPMTSTIEAAGLLHFSLRIIKEGSGSIRQSTLFQQGEPLLLEAAVHAPMHPPLWIYVDHCVATANSDPFSMPSHEFISNHGCLVDSMLPNSSSKFYTRQKKNVLRFRLQAFDFSEDERKQVFISCQLRTAPHHSASDLQNKACHFHRPSSNWHSVEGDNTVCLCCETGDCKARAVDKSTKYLQGKPATVSVGPLQILPTNSHWTGKLTIT